MDLKKNFLVLYKEQPAIILEVAEKILIELPQKKTLKVREKDFFLLSTEEVKSLKAVLEYENSQDATCTQNALAECYELLEGEPTSFLEAASLAWSDFNPEGVWFYWQAFKKSELFFIQDGKVFPRSQEEITQLKQKNEEKQKEQDLRKSFIVALKTNTISVITNPENARFLQEVEALALGKTEKSKILEEAGFSENPENAHKLLLRVGFWSSLKNPHPQRFGLSINSSSKELLSPPEEERLDLTQEKRFISWAIDAEDSTDPDDAVCFDGEFFWIHVADPASGIAIDSVADIDARNRGATHYLPEGVARMLPEKALEYYALGILPVSRALSFKVKLGLDGEIESTEILKTLIRVERISYAKADEFLTQDELKLTETAQALLPLYEFSQKNLKRRLKNGAVWIELPEVKIRVKDDTVFITEDKKYKSSELVREMMLLAGEAAARFAFEKKIPFQFISQEAPSLPKDLPDGLAGQFALRKGMRSRQVGVTPAAHQGLGLGMYAQVTSPLRRYGDLAVHQQLRLFLDKKPLLDKDTLFMHIAQGDAANVASIKAERASNLHWKLVYLQQNPNWQGVGIVVDFKNEKALVMIPSLALETLITVPKETTLNQTFTLKAGNIRLYTLEADFSII